MLLLNFGNFLLYFNGAHAIINSATAKIGGEIVMTAWSILLGAVASVFECLAHLITAIKKH